MDTHPPVSSITNATAAAAGARRAAYFAFAAVDAVPVSFACRLSAAAGPDAAQDALVPQVGAWAACTSPQVKPMPLLGMKAPGMKAPTNQHGRATRSGTGGEQIQKQCLAWSVRLAVCMQL